jgi:hypothetical protein
MFWFYKILVGVYKVMNKGLSEAKGGTRDAEGIKNGSKVKERPK